MKNEVRPIDKSKTSNHRCINCSAWDNRVKNKTRDWSDPSWHCPKSGKDINYWNRCPLFRWNPNKVYKENEDHGEGSQTD